MGSDKKEMLVHTRAMRSIIRPIIALLILISWADPGLALGLFRSYKTIYITTVKSGAWSDASVWSTGVVPGEGADVRISEGHKVIYGLKSTAGIRILLVNGTLSFARDRDTLLEVGLLVVSNDPKFKAEKACAEHRRRHVVGNGPIATLEVGTPGRPMPARVTAKVRLKPFSDLDPDCAPGLINHGGRMDFWGASLKHTWVKLRQTAAKGATVLTLAQAVDWKPGDIVVVTATAHTNVYGGRDPIGSFLKEETPQTEERIVQSVSTDGKKLTLAEALRFEHRGGEDSEVRRGEVANLTRNVVIESAEPKGSRGHTMYHKGGLGSIGYTELRHLGKRGVLGRYPVHYHLVKDSMRGSMLVGSSIWDSHNRWVVVHGSEYLVVKDNVGYRSIGHGFFLEDGSEVYNLFQHNLGVQTYVSDPIPGQALEYDENDGACYWAANARNFLIDSVFVECDNNDSFVLDFPPDEKDLRIKTLQPDGARKVIAVNRIAGGRIKGLEVHSHHGWGPWIRGGVFPEHAPLTLEDTRVWDVHYSIDISGDNVVFDGVKVYDSSYGFYNLYPGPHLVRNAYMHNVGPHGAFMTYRGGHGEMIYENLTVKGAELVFRVTAKNEEGPSGRPIFIHTRNFKVIDPVFQTPGGEAHAHWVGTEDDNVRQDPLLMLVMHDMFGRERDAVILPEIQSEKQRGVPQGLSFRRGDTVKDTRGIDFSGRGEMKVAEGRVGWPSSPLLKRPVDHIPPASIILSPRTKETVHGARSLTVTGVALDQFNVHEVRVNGEIAVLDKDGIGWRVDLVRITPGPLSITAVATDRAGNREMTGHTIDVTVTP